MERIAQIRRQIAAGTYETTEKLSLALDVFIERQQSAGRSTGREEK
jgi:hypothetical protein